ncbi:tyrosine-type recombinase/integrase [Nitrospira sp. Kam-Ns4a]
MTRARSPRGGTITRLGEKRYRITWHQGRGKPNLRRIIHGTREQAERVLAQLRARALEAQFGLTPTRPETPVSVLTALVVTDYRNNNYKSLKSALQLQAFWDRLAGTQRAEAITGDQLQRWATEWRRAGLSPARVNRRMAFLLRGYRLALRAQPPLVTRLPPWTKLAEAPPRSGFWTWEDFVRVRALLPPHARIPVTIMFWLGTRLGETLALTWRQVRFDHTQRLVEIQLEAADTKTKEARRAFLGGDLYETLWAWKQASEAFKTPWVCHRQGKRLTSIRNSWYTACVKAGVGRFERPEAPDVSLRRYRGPLLHDFRRTAVSRMEAAGVPRKVAMAISGHKTDSVYRRYHIVSQQDLLEAGRRLLAYHNQQHSPHGEHLVNTSLDNPQTDRLSY